MRSKTAIVTGSCGLIGSEAVLWFDRLGWSVIGIDNNMRRRFFGPEGDTSGTLVELRRRARRYEHMDLDVRHRDAVAALFRERRVDCVVHCAAQPSHDLAAAVPFDDWDVNAGGTMNLLEAARRSAPEAPFLHMSTNKVYGSAPNERPLVELETRFDYAREEDRHGIDESCRIDASLHSLFGASKTAADVAAQEYGRYFGMPVGVFRAGCLTGARHCGVVQHGFLSYLVRVAARGGTYTVYGYGGKQVRDNLDALDVLGAMDAFMRSPSPGEVYNLGGGRENSVSVREAIERVQALTGRRLKVAFDATERLGDHICYISDTRKLRGHFPSWRVTRPLDGVLEEMVRAAYDRAESPRMEAP